jgi:transposase
MSATARVTIEPVDAEPAAKPKRRRHSLTQKRQIVEESFDPRTSVARVAHAHGINANLVFTWRRQYQRGQLGAALSGARSTELLPVRISESPAVPATLPASASVTTLVPTGTIQLQLGKGRLRIEGVVDPASLRVVLECLLA